MKRFCASFITIIFVCFIFTSFSPSVDGRAIVADPGVMPQGVFAKTVGYLPGDTISVTNLAKNATVDILVIGALDASEGVAILLTPEAAEVLGIPKDSNNVVKITKRAGQLDEAVGGTAVITGSNDSYEPYITEAEPKAEEPPKEIEEVAEEVDEPKEVETEIVEEVVPAEVVEEVPTETEKENEIVAEKIEDELPSEVSDEIVPANEEVSEVVEEELPENVENEEVSEVIDDEPEVDETAMYEKIDDEVPSATEYDEGLEKVTDEYLANRSQDDLAENCESCEKVSADEIKPINEKEADEKVVSENLDEAEVEKPIVATVETDEKLENVEADELDALDDENYESIVLTPTEPNPPEVDETEEAEKNTTEQEEVAVSDVSSESEETSVPENDEFDFSKYTVDSLRDLESGKYYVQVAVYNDEENIQSFIDQYAKMYPITLVPLSSKKAMQVMVGPVNIDEYGAVAVRFKSFGFKDAFLRKVR